MHFVMWAFVALGINASSGDDDTCLDACKAQATQCAAECRELRGAAKKDCTSFCVSEGDKCEAACEASPAPAEPTP